MDSGLVLADISIHAPLTGSDMECYISHLYSQISIHAPLTGSDKYSFSTYPLSPDFNPRSPYGERQECFENAEY